MPTYEVDIPGSGKYSVDSPSDLTDQQAYLAVMQQIGRQEQPAEAPAAPVAVPKRAEDVGFLEGIGAAGRRGIESIGDVASGLGLAGTSLTGTDEETRRKMQAIRAEQMKPQQTPGTTFADLERIYKEKGLMSALGNVPKYAAEQIIQSAPQMAAPLAAGAAASPFITPIGGALVGMGVYGVQQFGNFLVRQAVEKEDPRELEVAKAALTAAGTAPIGYFADRFTVGLGSLGKSAGKEIVEELAKRSGMELAGGVAKQVGKGAVEGIIAEAPTEVLEQAAERYQAGLSLSDPEAMNEYKEAFFGAAAAGGGIKGVSTGLDLRSGIQQARQPEAEIPENLLPPVPEGVTEGIAPGEGAGIRELEGQFPPIGTVPEVVEPTIEAPPVPPIVETPPIQEAPPIEAPPAQPPVETPPVETPPVETAEFETLHPVEIAFNQGNLQAVDDAKQQAKLIGIDYVFTPDARIDLNNSKVDWNVLKKLNTGDKVLGHIRDFVPLDTRKIIDRITPYVKDIPVRVSNANAQHYGLHELRGYGPDATHNINLYAKTEKGNTFETIAHELVHGATVRNYYEGRYYNEHKDNLPTRRPLRTGDVKFSKASKELEDLTSFLQKNHANDISFFKNYKKGVNIVAPELLTWGTTNREAQEQLKRIKLPNGQSVWSKFVEVMRNLLNIPASETNALTRILELQDQLIGGKPAKPYLKPRARRAGAGVITSEAQEVMQNPNFRKWFGDSKVVDEDGNPLVMYHGTNKNELGGAFSTFDTYASNYGLMGMGSYFTDSQDIANEYTEKGRGETPSVYPVYLSINNPLDMDQKADPSLWKKAFEGIEEYHEGGNTNESWYRAAEELMRDQQYPMWEGAEAMQDGIRSMGYDGITHIGGGRVKQGGAKHRVYIAFDPNQIKSAIGNKGAYSEESPIISESMAPRTKAIGGPAPEPTWNAPPLEAGSWSSRFANTKVYEYLDKYVDLKDVIKAINSGKNKLDETWNAYRRETLYHNRVAFMTDRFLKKGLKPLAEDMVKRNITEAELNNYLLARFAEERNDAINERNPDAKHLQHRGSGVDSRIARAYMLGATPEQVVAIRNLLAKNSITLNENEEALLADLAKMSDAKRKNLAEVAKRVDAIVKETQDIAVAGGLEKESTVDYWRRVYPNYVPLKRSPEELDFVEKNYGSGKGFSTKSGFGRAATGSLKTVDNILANIVLQRDMAIVRSEKGRIARALYAMALQHPNVAFWLPVNPEAGVIGKANDLGMKIAKTKEKIQKKSDKIDADEAAGRGTDKADLKEIEIMREQLSKDMDKHVQLMEQAEAAKNRMKAELSQFEGRGLSAADIENLIREPQGAWYNPKTGLVEHSTNAYLRSSPNVLAVPVDGETRYIFFNPGDARAKRLINSLKSSDVEQLGEITAIVGRATRWIAKVNTQFNPFFGIVNWMRDVQGAQFNLSSTPLAGKQMAVNANIPGAMSTIYRSIRAERNGEAPVGPFAADWLQFQELGGPTGIKDMLAREQDKLSVLGEEINKLQEGTAKKLGRRGIRAAFDLMSDFNDTMENSVRLAAFVEAKKKFAAQGFKPDVAADKAAELAKNLTVNFNRKGQKSQLVNSWFAFFNAAAQGSARLYETLTGPAGKKIAGSLFLLGAIQQLMLASAGFDEEDPPEFVREKNLIIPTSGGKYISVPMPLGFNALVNVGRIITAAGMDGGKHKARYVENMLSTLSNTFNPFGSSGLSAQTLAPTVADPFVALGENRDAFGRPISRPDQATKPIPGYLRSSEGASEISKYVAQALNHLSGGTDYQKGWASPTADQIDYLAGQVGGGSYREAKKVVEYAKAQGTGEEVAPYKVPLAGRFMGDTGSDANVRNRFYQNITQMSQFENELKGRAKDHKEIQSFLKEHPEARLYDAANSVENEIIQMNKMRKELIARNAPKEQLKRLNDMKIQRMRQLNEMIEKATPK